MKGSNSLGNEHLPFFISTRNSFWKGLRRDGFCKQETHTLISTVIYIAGKIRLSIYLSKLKSFKVPEGRVLVSDQTADEGTCHRFQSIAYSYPFAITITWRCAFWFLKYARSMSNK